jgi:hypothetical protein
MRFMTSPLFAELRGKTISVRLPGIGTAQKLDYTTKRSKSKTASSRDFITLGLR